MFYDCFNLTNLNLSNFNTQNVTNMSRMFYNCESLTNLNLSNFNTQKATNISGLFYNCKSLINLNLFNFNTQNVTNMSYMFYNCEALTNLFLSNFNTQNVTNMSSMFYNCKSLINLNLSNFNTQNVTNMSNMLYNCEALINLKYQNPIVVQSIFQSKEFLEMNLNVYKNSKELSKLKVIQRDLVCNNLRFSYSQLDYEGNKISGWSINEKRGDKPYYPPLGWIGFGLKVKNYYDNYDNSWLGNNNIPGEWCVAYHGVKYITIIKKIYMGGFRPSGFQAHKDCQDIHHPGKNVGVGVYFTSNPETAGEYGGIYEFNGRKYKTILMVRIKPDTIRSCNHNNNDILVANGTLDEVRPYRILLKEC